MTNRPSTPEIISVNSEELEALIRNLLPSQNGFGSELQATNVITPIIDLTATAEGSTLRSDLQTALAFGSQTAFRINNASTTLANSPGFYRIIGTASAKSISAVDGQLYFEMTDGLSTKRIWDYIVTDNGTVNNVNVTYDFVVWLDTGITLNGFTNRGETYLSGSIRQIADSAGAFVNPAGFPL